MSENIFQFNCGDVLKDSVTGYQGTVMARIEWLNGCIRYVLQSKAIKDGVPVGEHTVDEQQCTLVKAAKPKAAKKKPIGGSRHTPSMGKTLRKAA